MDQTCDFQDIWAKNMSDTMQERDLFKSKYNKLLAEFNVLQRELEDTIEELELLKYTEPRAGFQSLSSTNFG